MIVTLCGSVRFEAQFIEAQRELSRRGINFFSLAVLPQHREADETWQDGGYDKVIADLLYFDRIINSDAVVVLGDGYIGFSTAREILWADIQKKLILAHRPGDRWDVTAHRIKLRAAAEHPALVARARAYFAPKPSGMEHPFGYDAAEEVAG